nr:ferritin-like domain-containing protein [Longispora sp. (in: high G+C Gram-positive bacteria)]
MNREHQQTSTEDVAAQLSTPAAVNRRRFLVGSAVVAMGAALAACGDDNEDGGTTTGTPTTTKPTTGNAGEAGDLAVAELAAGLEVLAVNTYQGALEAATAGKLGTVPPAVATYATTALAHHKEHLAAWNKVLTGAGKNEVTTPNATLKPVVDAEFAKVKDVGGVANLALMLEDIAAQTYLKAIPTLTSKDAIKLAGSIQVVDQQHQSILLY